MSNPDTVSRFDEIYDSTKKQVLALITAKCANTADISDIFQETYMELYRALLRRGTQYIKNDKAFAMKLARYYSMRDRLRNIVSLTSKNEDNEEYDLSDFDANEFLTEDFTVNNIMLETIRQHIASKPDIVRKAFYLFYNVGLSIPEIAGLLSISESNVKNHLYRTLKEMREHLN